MTKTLHVVSLPRRGGLEVMFLNFLKRLKERNKTLFDQQVIYALNCSEDIKNELQEIGISNYDVQFSDTSKIKIVRDLLKIVKQENLGIVYGQNHSSNVLVSMIGLINKKVKVVTHEHGTIWKTNSIRKFVLNQFWITFSDTIICNSQATHIYISERFRVNSKKLNVILNGVPEMTGNIENYEVDGNTILYIGRLWEMKSVETLIFAVNEARYSHRDITLRILGDGPERDKLESLVDYLSLEKHVIFHGSVDNVNQYILKSSLVVVPSIRESLGNVVIEAALLGVPSVAARVDGLSEVIVDYETGRLITPTEKVTNPKFPKYVVDSNNKRLVSPKKLNVSDLSSVIIDCLDNPEQTKKMGANAREWVSNHFSMDKYVEEISRILK